MTGQHGRFARGALAIALVAALFCISACTSGNSTGAPTAVTPVPTDLLASSATAMADVTTAHFTLAAEGQLPAVTVQQAEGDLTAAGDAQGTASIVQLGQLIEAEFVLVDGQLYLKGPTGGFSQLPAALAASVYDPSIILDPQDGVAKLLKSVTSPTVTGSDNGSWVVSGTVPGAVAAGLVPGLTGDVEAQFTITMTDNLLSSAAFELAGADGQPASVTVELSELNSPVSITAPG